MKKLFLILVMVLLASAMFAEGGQEGPAGGAEFIIGNGAEPESLDWHLVSGVPEHRIYMSLYEGLITYDPKTAEGIPALAESWEVSSDGTVYTFKLRKTTWSDGVAITAHTVVDSWIRGLNPETGSQYAWFPSMFIKGAAEFNGGDAGPEAVQIRALDDYTFQMELIGPLPYVIGALPHYSFGILPLHAIERYGDAWTNVENYVSNGPFILESWRPQEQITVVPNPTYWDAGAVKLARVTYLPIDDNNTAYNMFLNGEIDWQTAVPLDQIEAAQLRDDFHVNPQLATYYYYIENTKPPFDDPRVRKALAMSFDKVALTKQVTKAGEVPTNAMVPPMTGYPGIEGNGYDVAAAQQFLADAGYPGGAGFPKFEILYNTSEGHKKIAEFIQQEWLENLGIECELYNQEWKTYLATTRNHDFQVARAGWVGDYQDPNTFLDMFITGAGMNKGQYSNPEYDELVEGAAYMDPGPARFAQLTAAEEIFITEDQGLIPIYHYTTKNMVDTSKWGGWYENIMDYHPPKAIYLK